MQIKAPRINQKGIGLVEVIVALGISITVITSLVSLSLFTMRSALQSTALLESGKYASKEIELVRAYRDSVTWSQFIGDMGSCTLVSPCSMGYFTGAEGDLELIANSGASVENADTPQQLTRYFYATVSGDSQSVRIVAEVSWQMGSQTKKTNLYTDFTNWQNR